MPRFVPTGRRMVLAGLAAVALGTTLLGTGGAAAAARPVQTPPPPANAVAQAVCQHYSDGTGDLCLYYLKGANGSRAAFYYNDPSLWDNFFQTPGSGNGQVVADNAEAYWNLDHVYTVFVYTEPDCTGDMFTIPPGVAGNFPPPFLNNVESICWS